MTDRRAVVPVDSGRATEFCFEILSWPSGVRQSAEGINAVATFLLVADDKCR
jgi:hypothetical protein